jgi:hypothetical protein
MKRTATGAMPVPDIDPSQGRQQISWSYADLHLAGTSTTVARADGNIDCPSTKYGSLLLPGQFRGFHSGFVQVSVMIQCDALSLG